MPATGSSFKTVIGAHHTMYLRFSHQFPESGQVSIPKVIHGNTGVIRMAVVFRTAVYGIMFSTSHRFQILRIISFQAVDDRRTHFGCQVRVLAIGFLSTSPAGITEDIDIRSPISQSTIDFAGLACFQVFIEQGTSFRRGHISHLLKGFRVEGGSHTDRLRENSHLFLRTSHAMQRFVPPVISRNTQTGNSRGGMLHQLDFFFQRQTGNDILYPDIQRKVRITKRIVVRLCRQAAPRESGQ